MSEDILDSNEVSNGQRPQFLTVLCILTFIGSGLGLLGGLLGLVGSSALSSFMPAGSTLWLILGLISSGLCLYGAVQMWGLKKQGLMLYFAGTGLYIIIALIQAATYKNPLEDLQIDGVDYSSLGGGSIWGSTIFGIVIAIAFAAMYNRNKEALVN